MHGHKTSLSGHDTVFDNSGLRLVLKDQYLEVVRLCARNTRMCINSNTQLSTHIPAAATLFGLATREFPEDGRMALRRDGYPWPLWNRDAGPEDGNGNTYGSHPIVWVQHPGLLVC